eukprot:TRINITY_DN5282_c0_g1_i1.p1 TRINITY_DN5282_c0_g1~~TRINITY_DN5282_c0_g1_i1.p1  ORF type:complete len:1609 (+),score=275.00 TRINITY_DN5282_c0_g1_i1:735-5561(+)
MTGSYGYFNKGYILYGENEPNKIQEKPFHESHVIGFGLDVKSSTLFFTWQGNILPLKIRNAKGKFYPAVGIISTSASVSVNFGQMPYVYDLSYMKNIIEERNSINPDGRVPYKAFSLSSEVIALIRLLMNSENWRNPIINIITIGINSLPQSLSLNNSESMNRLLMGISSMDIIGGYYESLRVGGRVRVYVEDGQTEEGFIIDYKPDAWKATVYLDSDSLHEEPREFNLNKLKPIPEIPINSRWFDLIIPEIRGVILQFLQSNASSTTLYQHRDSLLFVHLKEKVMKIISYIFENKNRARIFLLGETDIIGSVVNHLLVDTVPFQDLSFSSSQLDILYLRIRQRLFEAKYPVILSDSPMVAGVPFEECIQHHHFNAFVDEISDIVFKGIEHEDISGIEGKKIRWNDISLGSQLVVAHKEVNWSSELDYTLGKIGIVIAIEKNSKRVLLRFYDADTGLTFEWWYSIHSLYTVNHSENLERLLSLNELPILEMEKWTKQIEQQKIIYNATQAIFNLICNNPRGNLVTISSLGGSSKIVEILKMVTNQYIVQSGIRLNYSKLDFEKIQSYMHPSLQLFFQKFSHVLKKHKLNETDYRDNVNFTTLTGFRKTGMLVKQGKMFKQNKRYLYGLKDDCIFYFKNEKSLTPLGYIELHDIQRVNILDQKKVKKDHGFVLLTTSGRTMIFLASNLEDRDDWINQIRHQKRIMTNTLVRSTKNSLYTYLFNECAINLQNNSNAENAVTVLFRPPYSKENTSLKKCIIIPEAKRLLVVFDNRCSISKKSVLRFYKDVRFTNLISSHSGTGEESWPFTIIDSNTFWIDFNCENSESALEYWGIKFTVYPFVIGNEDPHIPRNGVHSFNFGYLLLQWFLNLCPRRTIHGLSDCLIERTDTKYPVQERIQMLTILRKFLQRTNMMHVLRNGETYNTLFLEANELYNSENMYSRSLLFKTIFEFLICIDTSRATSSDYEDTIPTKKENIKVVEKDIKKSKNDKGGDNELDTDKKKTTNEKKRKKVKRKAKEKKEQISSVDSWFNNSKYVLSIMKSLLKRQKLPDEFLTSAILEAQKEIIIEESPHPYPHGVSVTNEVYVPDAEYLVLSFDPRSKTEPNFDYLMVSKDTVGASDIGIWSGTFTSNDIIIQGNKFVWSFLSDSYVDKTNWGFRLIVTPIYREEKINEQRNLNYDDIEDLKISGVRWTRSMDLQLVQWINHYCSKNSITSREINISDLDVSELKYYHLLSNVNVSSLLLRISVLKYFNNLIFSFFPLVDFSLSDDETSVASKVTRLRGYVFYDVKVKMINIELERTESQIRRPLVSIKRTDSQDSKDLIFTQVYSSIHHLDPALLKHNDKAWGVKFENEGATDAGGPYRECITQMCVDVHNPDLGILTPCSNMVHQIGENQDKYLLNPECVSSESLGQIEFLGKLLGISIRTNHNLDLSFPSLIWKNLVGIKPDRSDISEIDLTLNNYLDQLSSPQMTKIIFSRVFSTETFSVPQSLSSDKNVLLKPKGDKIPVTWENRNEYVKLLEEYKLSEYNKQIEYLKYGMNTIIPVRFLQLFTSQELEYRICGVSGVNLNVLKSFTVYVGGLKSSDPHIKMFWEVLDSFSAGEQVLFLRF